MTDEQIIQEQDAGGLSSEELMARIREEARFLEQVVEEQPLVRRTPELPEWRAPSLEFPVKAVYHVNEFLVYDGVEFVVNAYRGILRREADESGLDTYVAFLREQGPQEKMAILLNLLESDEARASGVHVQGIRWEKFARRHAEKWWFQRRGFQTLFKLVRQLQRNNLQDYTLYNEGQRQHSQRAINTYLGKQHEMAAYLEQRQQQIAVDHEQLHAVVAHYRQDMQAVRQQMLGQQAQLNALLNELRDKVNGGELRPEQEVQLATHASDKLDAFYLAFENAARGDESEIRDQLSVYLPHLKAAGTVTTGAPLLDVGSGRGEWLALLRDEGLSAKGVDVSAVLADHCARQNLDVTVADGIAHLRSLPDASLGAVSAFHVIEHLPFESLYDLVEQCFRVLVPGGVVIFETPNPENLMVGSHTFYHDPTHRNPITPTLIEFLLQHLGLENTELLRLHPYPADALVVGMDPLTDRINGAFCGPQDFAVLGYKPA